RHSPKKAQRHSSTTDKEPHRVMPWPSPDGYDHGDRDNPEPWVQKYIDTLNEEAEKLSKAVDAFEKYGRSRLSL
ncbi:MAG: hypothetical protein ACK4ZW_12135, partial [Blastomonas sp.]